MARPRSEAARTRVLDAALALIASEGMAKFSIDAVARESGVAKTTIYRHWKSGDHLIIDALDALVAPFPTPNTGALRSDLRSLMEQMAPIINDDGIAGMMLDILRAALDNPELERIHRAMMEERAMPLVTVIDLAKGRGEINADLPSSFAIDLVEGIVFARRFMSHQLLDDSTIDEAVDLMCVALTSW